MGQRSGLYGVYQLTERLLDEEIDKQIDSYAYSVQLVLGQAHLKQCQSHATMNFTGWCRVRHPAVKHISQKQTKHRHHIKVVK